MSIDTTGDHKDHDSKTSTIDNHDVISVGIEPEDDKSQLVELLERTIDPMLERHRKIYIFHFRFWINHNQPDSAITTPDKVIRDLAECFINDTREIYEKRIVPKFHNCQKSYKELYPEEYKLFECKKKDFKTVVTPECEYIWTSHHDHKAHVTYTDVAFLLTKSSVIGYSDIDEYSRYGSNVSHMNEMEYLLSFDKNRDVWNLTGYDSAEDMLEDMASQYRLHDEDLLKERLFISASSISTPTTRVIGDRRSFDSFETDDKNTLVKAALDILLNPMPCFPKIQLQAGASR